MSYSYKSHGDLIERAVLEQMDRRSAAFKAAWTGGAMRLGLVRRDGRAFGEAHEGAQLLVPV